MLENKTSFLFDKWDSSESDPIDCKTTVGEIEVIIGILQGNNGKYYS